MILIKYNEVDGTFEFPAPTDEDVLHFTGLLPVHYKTFKIKYKKGCNKGKYRVQWVQCKGIS